MLGDDVEVSINIEADLQAPKTVPIDECRLTIKGQLYSRVGRYPDIGKSNRALNRNRQSSIRTSVARRQRGDLRQQVHAAQPSDRAR